MRIHEIVGGGEKAGKMSVGIAIYSLIFTVVNATIHHFMLRHSYPLSIFPAFSSFFLIYYLFRGKLPGRNAIIIFIGAFTVYTGILQLVFSHVNGIGTFDIFLFMEPLYFIPVVVLVMAIRTQVMVEKFVPMMLITCGGIMVCILFISIIPNNPITAIFLENTDPINLLDSMVNPKIIGDLFFYYHGAVILGSFGTAALLLGTSIRFMDMKYSDLTLLVITIIIPFTVYIVGVPLLWVVLRDKFGLNGDEKERDSI